MQRNVRRVAIVLVSGLALVVSAVWFGMNPNRFRPALEAQLTRTLGRPVKAGDLRLDILSGGVIADDLSVAGDAADSGPLLHTRSLTLGVDWWQLIAKRQIQVRQITLVQPQIELVEYPSGGWNVSSLGAASTARTEPPASPSSSAGLNLAVKLVKVLKGRITFSQRGSTAKARALDSVNAELRDFGAGSVFPFHLTGKIAGEGDLELDGMAGPLNRTDIAETPAKATVKLSKIDLSAAGVASLAGQVSFDGSAASTGTMFSLAGRLRAEQWKLAANGPPASEPLEFDFSLEHDMRKGDGLLRRGELHIGAANARLTGTYAIHGESLALNMTLSGLRVPVPQLAQLLPALEGGTEPQHFTAVLDLAPDGWTVKDQRRLNHLSGASRP